MSCRSSKTGFESVTLTGPFCICVEVEIPVVDTGYVNAIPIQLNHIPMIAAIGIPFLVLYDNEERIRGYSISSAHEPQR